MASTSSSRTAIALAAMLLLTGGVALGQETGLRGQIEMAAEMTPDQKLEFSTNAISEMEGALARVQSLRKSAESSGDPERIECVGAKLRAIKNLHDVSMRANTRMTEALADNQTFKADTELRQIAVALSKVRQFVAEAEACVGEAGTSQGSTARSFDGPVDGGVDETEAFFAEGEIGVDPPNTTPFE